MTGFPKLPKVSRLSLKVWQRNSNILKRNYKVNLLAPFLEPLFYLFAFGFGLGVFVGTLGGVSYTAYFAPAIIAISVMNSSFFECTYGSFVRMHYQKTYDAMIATPLTIEDVIMGEILWGATRALINGAIILFVVAAFGLVSLPMSLLILPLAFLGGLLFAALGMVFAAIVPGIDSLNYPTFLLITPMLLFGGTFFPLAILPAAMQMIAFAFPLTHLVSLTRAITLNNLSWLNLVNLLWILGVTALIIILAIKFMKARLIK